MIWRPLECTVGREGHGLGNAGYKIEGSVKRPPDGLVGLEFGVSR